MAAKVGRKLLAFAGTDNADLKRVDTGLCYMAGRNMWQQDLKKMSQYLQK
jgi:hypothetical protein